MRILHPKFECLPSQEGDEGFYWSLSGVCITAKEGRLSTEKIIIATSGQKFETVEECKAEALLVKEIASQADIETGHV